MVGHSNSQVKNKNMFERFSEKAIKVIMLAQEEARRLGHNFVGSEQMLLGLIGEGTGIAANSLKSLGVNLKDARVEVEKVIGRGSGFVAVEIPFTPRAKRILELSWDSARLLNVNYIGTEHLLLGLIKNAQDDPVDGCASKVLNAMNVDLERLKEVVLANIEVHKRDPVGASSETAIIDYGRSVAAAPQPSARALRNCPNCYEQISISAIICRFCQSGLSDNYFRPCPMCAEMIRKSAKLCRFCRSEVTHTD